MPAQDNGGTRSSGQRLSPGEGRAWWFLTDLYLIKAVSEDTNGAFTLTEVTSAPQSPPVPHIHHREDEFYYVLEGEFEFLDEDRTFTAGAGSLVRLPKHRLHSHRNPADVPSKALVLHTPAGIEKFVEEVSKPATDSTSLPPSPEEADIERLVTIAQEKYGFEVPPPPPG